MLILTNRIKNFKLGRKLRFFWQRLTRDWDDSETWCMDWNFAKHILPRLRRFKQITKAYPTELTPEQWDEILDQMIYSFYYYASEKEFQWNVSNDEYAKVQRGLDLFAQYYRDLWW